MIDVESGEYYRPLVETRGYKMLDVISRNILAKYFIF